MCAFDSRTGVWSWFAGASQGGGGLRLTLAGCSTPRALMADLDLDCFMRGLARRNPGEREFH